MIDGQTGEKVVGYSKSCTFQIGETVHDSITKVNIAKYQSDTLAFVFSQLIDGNDIPRNTLGSVSFGGKYITSRGIKIGDSIQKIESVYGKPKARVITYWEDPQHGIYWTFNGLFYNHLSFLTRDSIDTIPIAIYIGDYFDLNPKYIKKR